MRCGEEVEGMESVITPLNEFAKNSARLVKRCTKPDKKGGLFQTLLSCAQTATVVPGMTLLLTVSFCICRVHQNLHQDSCGLHRHGLHWILRQTHFHCELLCQLLQKVINKHGCSLTLCLCYAAHQSNHCVWKLSGVQMGQHAT